VAYLKRSWYVAAWDCEIKREGTFHRTILDESILFFRDSGGIVHAISNRCPHRFAPLHKGVRMGDAIACAYHGLQFDGKGRCVHNPQGNGFIPKTATVRSYPVVEKYSAIWIWMGEPEIAEASTIPDFSFNDPSEFFVGKRYLHARANYVLETDNIMDLSHIQYLHPGTLGSDSVSHAETEVIQKGNTVYSKRLVKNEILPDFLYAANKIEPGTRVDRWIDVRWDAPANMALFVGAVPSGGSIGSRIGRVISNHFTPETKTTTHYWFANSYPRTMGSEGEALAEQHIEGLNRPFRDEDLPMLEAQQTMMGDADFWSLKPVFLAGDAGAVRARRVLDKLVEDEQLQTANTNTCQ
jgi:phenylpropionate dioxygenase-like ring-hydroxylating dioxygenase large terminal subunit